MICIYCEASQWDEWMALAAIRYWTETQSTRGLPFAVELLEEPLP